MHEAGKKNTEPVRLRLLEKRPLRSPFSSSVGTLKPNLKAQISVSGKSQLKLRCPKDTELDLLPVTYPLPTPGPVFAHVRALQVFLKLSAD